MYTLEGTPLHYGGYRHWFICPYTKKRVAKLYGMNGADKFGSRQAFNLSYASQSENEIDRALSKKWKILDKCDGDYDWPVRPKGMHHKTFEKIINRYNYNENIIDGHLMQW